MNTNRRRIVYLPENFLGTILKITSGDPSCQFFYLPRLTGLPDGCKVESVRHDWERRALGVMISHDSFDEVPDGLLPPVQDMEHITVELAAFRFDEKMSVTADALQRRLEETDEERRAARTELEEFNRPWQPLAKCIRDMRANAVQAGQMYERIQQQPFIADKPNIVQEHTEKVARTRLENIEMLAAAFVKETGLDPCECELVEISDHAAYQISWYFRKRKPGLTRDPDIIRTKLALPAEVVHYAPYGPNANFTYDCGVDATGKGYTKVPANVTCEGCKRANPGLWRGLSEKGT